MREIKQNCRSYKGIGRTCMNTSSGMKNSLFNGGTYFHLCMLRTWTIRLLILQKDVTTHHYYGLFDLDLCWQHLQPAYQPLTLQACPLTRNNTGHKGSVSFWNHVTHGCTATSVCTVAVQVKIASEQLQILWPNLGQITVS